MRMHSYYGKCSPNLVLGALLVFSLIVLYNYWNVSAFNKDLVLKLHTLEQQAIALANANDAIRSNYDKTEDQKSKLEESLGSQIKADELLKSRLSNYEKTIGKLEKENERLKKESKKSAVEIAKLKDNLDSKTSELTDIKSTVVELQAQIKDKESKILKLQKSLELAEKSPSGSISNPTNGKVDDSLLQPVLMNDPAVPYPPGWMDTNYSNRKQKIHVTSRVLGNSGQTFHGQPVIVFDPPELR